MGIWIGVIIAFFLLFFTSLFLYNNYKLQFWKRHGIYSPKATPFLGHFRQMLNKGDYFWIFLDSIYKKKRNTEKFFGVYGFLQPNLTIMDPELCQRVLIKDFEHFVDRQNIDMRGTKNEVLNDILTNATGNHWKKIRSVISPTFTSGRMKNMFHLVQDKVMKLVEHCTKYKDSNNQIELKKTFNKFTLDVIASVAFGLEINGLDGENSQFVQSVSQFLKVSTGNILKRVILFISPKLFGLLGLDIMPKGMDYLIDVVKTTIREREKSGAKRGDFLDLMLEARSSNKNDDCSKTLSDDCIVAQSILFLLAGFDTTATALCFIVYCLAKHPQSQESLRKRLIEVTERNSDESLTYSDIMEDKMLEGVVAEALRLYPPAPFTQRLCVKDYTFPGTSLSIKKGLPVNVPIYSFHHDHEYFPDPEKFLPERFYPENKHEIPSGVYMPFGAGPRMCIAQRFALMEAKLVVAHLLLNFELRLAPGCEELKLSKIPGIIRPEDDSLYVVLRDLKRVTPIIE